MAASFWRSYLKESRRPIYAAAIVAPFFVVYHIGTFFLRATYINGADALIIRLLRPLSVNALFASALVLLACFCVWQWRSGGRWTVDAPRLLLMCLESLAWAVCLLWLFSQIYRYWPLSAPPAPPGQSRLGALVLYCGAGIYEELVFRGFLLGGLLLLFRKLMSSRTGAAVVATLIGAFAFALFHYIGPGSDPFTLESFLQRSFAGIYFSGLFVTRGFGITAASHALYDILVGLLLP